MSDSFVTKRTAAHQAPLSVEFSRQEYWCGLPRPPPGDLPNPEIEPKSRTLQADSLLLPLGGILGNAVLSRQVVCYSAGVAVVGHWKGQSRGQGKISLCHLL